MKGINIFSGEPGLGGALTNPTELSRKKGSITKAYPVTFEGRWWPDVETAYLVLRGEGKPTADDLMADLLAAKFRQHPDLFEEVKAAGGAEFLATCSHWTPSKAESFSRWEGDGLDSRFIRNLVDGYRQVEAGTPEKQGSFLF